MMSYPPKVGQVLTNAEITTVFKVGNMGGMRRSRQTGCLLLITDPFKSFYQDKWNGNVLHYTGMGKKGDQSFTQQNTTLRDAHSLGLPVHLLEVYTPTKYTYLGEVELCADIYSAEQNDEAGSARNVLIFPLRLKQNTVELFSKNLKHKEASLAQEAKKRKTAALYDRVRLLQGAPGKRSVSATCYERNQDLVTLVKRIAEGNCSLCRQRAPFETSLGEPYLEVHHIQWLSNGGSDTLDNTVALCPNCHRKMHLVNLQTDIDLLSQVARAQNQ